MREEAQRFWARARECRVIADSTADEAAQKLLLEIAEDLEAEARSIEADSPQPS
ncbi:hypothetical protein ACUXST_001400 [Sphingomonas sp. F9_3S_D5_B_2]